MNALEILSLCQKGRSATHADLASARRRLLADPNDVGAHALLLGAETGEERFVHVFWFIDRHPEIWLLGFSTITPDRPEHAEGARLWDRALASSPTVAVATNAARYHFFSDPTISETIMLSLRRSAEPRLACAAIAQFYEEWRVFAIARNTDATTLSSRALEAQVASFAVQPVGDRLGILDAMKKYVTIAPKEDFRRLRDLAVLETEAALRSDDEGVRESYLRSAAGLLFLGLGQVESAEGELVRLLAGGAAPNVRLPAELLRTKTPTDHGTGRTPS